jgi:hypothetical protein
LKGRTGSAWSEGRGERERVPGKKRKKKLLQGYIKVPDMALI